MIKFAIVGFGNIGSRHAVHINDNPGAELVAVCDTDANKAEKIKTFSADFYTDFSDMLQRKEIDVVSICTPNHLHKAHTIAALEAGCHTITEKPMALSLAACEEMILMEQNTGKKIFAVKQNRYNPPVQAVKKLIETDKLGELFMVQVNCYWNRNDEYYQKSDWRGNKSNDGGCLYTQFSHFIDILQYLVGNITPLSGYIHNYIHPNIEIEDSGIFHLKSEKNTMISFNYSTATYEQNLEGSILILGSKGSVKIGGQYLNTIELQHIKDITIPAIKVQNKDNNYGTYKGSMSNHDLVIQNVIDVLNGKEKIMTSSEEGKNVVKTISEMYAIAKGM